LKRGIEKLKKGAGRDREGEERTRRLLMIPMAAEVLRVQGKKHG
jgi:hypothetical protein